MFWNKWNFSWRRACQLTCWFWGTATAINNCQYFGVEGRGRLPSRDAWTSKTGHTLKTHTVGHRIPVVGIVPIVTFSRKRKMSHSVQDDKSVWKMFCQINCWQPAESWPIPHCLLSLLWSPESGFNYSIQYVQQTREYENITERTPTCRPLQSSPNVNSCLLCLWRCVNRKKLPKF